MTIPYDGEVVGIDVGKHDLVAAVGGVPGVEVFGNDEDGIAALVHRVQTLPGAVLPGAVRIGLEATVCDVRQVAPAQVKAYGRSLGQQAKTDGIDAHMIASFLAFRPDAGRRLPRRNLRQIKGLTTLRRQFIEMRKTLLCQVQQAVAEAVASLETCLACIDGEIAATEARLDKLIAADAQMAGRAGLLRSIPGIGPVVCQTLLAGMDARARRA